MQEVLPVDSNVFRQRTKCRGVSAADVSPFQLIVSYENDNMELDSLRAMRTDLLLGGAELVRNNLLLVNNINLSHVETLGLLARWKEVVYDVRSLK